MRRATILLWTAICLPWTAWADGGLDPGFGVQGRYLFAAPAGHLTSEGPLLVQSDGQLLAYGRGSGCGQFAASRLRADGSALDPSFGTAGYTELCFNDMFPGSTGIDATPRASVATPDGSVTVLAGLANGPLSSYNYVFFLVKLDASGHAAAGFGNGGRVAVHDDLVFAGQHGYGLARRASDGVLFIAGSEQTDANGSAQATVWAYSATGSLLATFKDTTYTHSEHFGATMQTDGKLVTVGVAHNGTTNNDDCLVSRYVYQSGLFALDTSFNGSGRLLIAFDAGGTKRR